MSVQIVITAPQVAVNSIWVSEVTPEYDPVVHPDGWDSGSHLSPNPARSDIFEVVGSTIPAALVVGQFYGDTDPRTINAITFTPPLYIVGNNRVYNPLIATPQDWTPAYAADENYPDGLYTISLIVQGTFGAIDPGTNFSSQGSVTGFLYARAACCVANLHREIDACGAKCDSKLLIKAQDADTWLECLIDAVDCKQWDDAQGYLERLQEICEGRCGCC